MTCNGVRCLCICCCPCSPSPPHSASRGPSRTTTPPIGRCHPSEPWPVSSECRFGPSPTLWPSSRPTVFCVRATQGGSSQANASSSGRYWAFRRPFGPFSASNRPLARHSGPRHPLFHVRVAVEQLNSSICNIRKFAIPGRNDAKCFEQNDAYIANVSSRRTTPLVQSFHSGA